MKHKYILEKSNRLLTYFNEKGRDCFTYAEAFKVFPDASKSAVKELLSDMSKRGLLLRLKQEVYYIIPYEADGDTYMPDWHLVAQCLAGDENFYIGYYSALQIHNLITQPSLKEQIVTSTQFRPSKLEIRNVTFQFIYHNEQHFFGFRKIWIDRFHKVMCSDLEKTIVDCLFKPDYAGGIAELARAIYQIRGKLNYDTLLAYSKKFGSQAVIKRMGYLLELLDIGHSITDDLQQMRTRSYTVLDTQFPKAGKHLSRWSIQLNLDEDTIQSAIYT